MPTESSPSNVTSSNMTSAAVYLLFCTQKPVGPLVWFMSCVATSLVGVPASVWLLWVIIQRQRSGSSSDVFMFNLTIMDLMFSIVILPCVLNYYVWQSELFLHANVFFSWFALFGRPLFTTCICVECYLAVVHPVLYMKTMKKTYKMAACALVWIFTIVYGLTTTFTGRMVYTTVVIPYALYLPTIAFCDISILCALRKPGPSGGNSIHPQKQRAMQTITNSLVISTVAYLPPLVLQSLLPLIDLTKPELLCHIIFPSFIGPSLGSTIMPLLHLGNLGQLKSIWTYLRSR